MPVLNAICHSTEESEVVYELQCERMRIARNPGEEKISGVPEAVPKADIAR